MDIRYDSLSEIVTVAEQTGLKISDIMIDNQSEELGISKEALIAKMLDRYKIMKESRTSGLQEGISSVSGLSGGDAIKLMHTSESGTNICGTLFTKALAYAMSVSECNASMGKIVAAPTAGSCGILPASLISIQEEYGFDDEAIARVMFTASCVGMVIAKLACVAGAQGGCQAECGTASAMAAAAICELFDATPITCMHSVAITLKNVLGLVCDPVAGLVEVPCIKRNASGVATALMAAQLALAGIESKIPVDEVILAMKRVGDMMNPCLKETALGGLAATPSACAIKKRMES